MKRFVIAAAILVAAASQALAQEPSISALEALRQRLLGKATAVVEGRVYMEGRRPNDPSTPLAGIGVLIVPRSATLLQQLEHVKQQARESIDGFREAAPHTRAALVEYETNLWRLGYPDVAIRAVTDATGAFRADVPPGRWVMSAEHSVFLQVHAKGSDPAPTATALDPLARYSTTQYQHFLKVAKLSGFDAVSIWLRELDVEPGRTVSLDLHDRGVWLNGVAEETETPRRLRITGGGRKR